MEMKNALLQGLPALGLQLPDTAAQRLCDFGNAVIEQNKVMNLTAITEPVQVVKLHLLDSLTLLTLAELEGKRVIDVGCGAGFPGVPILFHSESVTINEQCLSCNRSSSKYIRQPLC